jgi:hypothetical protein
MNEDNAFVAAHSIGVGWRAVAEVLGHDKLGLAANRGIPERDIPFIPGALRTKSPHLAADRRQRQTLAAPNAGTPLPLLSTLAMTGAKDHHRGVAATAMSAGDESRR